MFGCTLIGGGFGGKETRYEVLALPVAVAAYKYVMLLCLMADKLNRRAITNFSLLKFNNYAV